MGDEDALFAEGDHVIGRYTLRSTHLGGFLDIPAAGKSITVCTELPHHPYIVAVTPVFDDLAVGDPQNVNIRDRSQRKLLGRLSGSWNFKSAGQSFRREVSAELIRALSSTG